jgi:hypothetical protein
MSELKPCFRCESENIIIIKEPCSDFSYYDPFYYHKCLNCGLRGKECQTEQEAIEWWDDRPDKWICALDKLPDDKRLWYCIFPEKNGRAIPFIAFYDDFGLAWFEVKTLEQMNVLYYRPLPALPGGDK